MDTEFVSELRNIALHCIGLARGCPHKETAFGLEEIAASLTEKALELEKSLNS